MKKQVLLKQLEYSIPPSATALTSVEKHHSVVEHLPLMKVAIDFINGSLKLEGDWHFLVTSNKHNENRWLRYPRERIKIEVAIGASSAINLNDPASDGLVFPMDGAIKDVNSLSVCSGLLILDAVTRSKARTGHRWNISFYLYDLQFDNCEIKFTLPIYLDFFDKENS